MGSYTDSHFSLTKACFVHKKNHEIKRKPTSDRENDPAHIMQYKKLWAKMENEIKEIEGSSHKETFNAVVNFIKGYKNSLSVGVREIPTAVLVMGVNMPDHGNIFSLLEKQIHVNGIKSTVILHSKDCNDLSSMLYKMVSELVSNYQENLNTADVFQKKLDFTLSKLLAWYNDVDSTKLTATPRKRSKKYMKEQSAESSSKPMVVLIQDVEAFDKGVLKEFILCCNLYVNQLPLVLVFGVASAMVTLHNLLPQKVLSCLGIETFYSLTATEYLTQILQKVVLSPEQPFKLGPRVFKLLVDTVLYHDFSVTNMTHMLKFCMIEHFHSNEVSILCCSLSSLEKNLQKLSLQQIQSFMKLQSFKDYFENNPQGIFTGSEKKLRTVILQHLKKLHAYHRFMIVLLECLHAITKDLPGYPLGKQLREIYVLSLENEITASPFYIQAERLLGMHSRDELEKKVNIFLQILNKWDLEESEELLYEVKKKLQNYSDTLNNLTEDWDYEVETKSVFDGEKISSRSQLQEKLRSRIKAQKRSKYEILRQNIVDYFTLLFKNLIPPHKMPLHEVLYFNNSAAVKKHMMAAPRVTFHRALVNPQQYLKCQCCKIGSYGEVRGSMPDISILYKLHTEYGKLINLHDWLQAFMTIKMNESRKALKEQSTKTDYMNSELQTRFLQAVSELQLIGFIKSTKRKKDHVARLTFGKL